MHVDQADECAVLHVDLFLSLLLLVLMLLLACSKNGALPIDIMHTARQLLQLAQRIVGI
jgi:hypothetical protein